ncbi:hypothetical protein E2C01_063437 [Portunus trituberculatus]|uniref:Uncharacterized protein n=1 Tax=Portunus trituberculatus TaxID=210409 RepID=A0A5B7HAG7_PORTR|nr:hypothetical protein [Portunus trituberculatus]
MRRLFVSLDGAEDVHGKRKERQWLRSRPFEGEHHTRRKTVVRGYNGCPLGDAWYGPVSTLLGSRDHYCLCSHSRALTVSADTLSHSLFRYLATQRRGRGVR